MRDGRLLCDGWCSVKVKGIYAYLCPKEDCPARAYILEHEWKNITTCGT